MVDARVSLVPFSRNVELADLRELRPLDTPGLGLGFDVGAHTYVFRLGVITFGVGGSLHYSVADQQPGERSPDPDGPTLRKRFTAFSSQLSFNFGGRDGWSYLSGGLGASRLSLYPLDAEEPPQRMTNTLNYGGGVRWFTSDRLAFSLDLRFYAISPLPQFEEQPGSPRMTQMALKRRRVPSGSDVLRCRSRGAPDPRPTDVAAVRPGVRMLPEERQRAHGVLLPNGVTVRPAPPRRL